MARFRTIFPGVLLITLSAAVTRAEVVHDPGVDPHEELDNVYERFRQAYYELDSVALGSLYTEDAFYLPPHGEILRGRERIEASFHGMFDRTRERGHLLRIRFRIVDRSVENEWAHDVGYFTLERFDGENRVSEDTGKFVVVAKRDAGQWRIHVDSYSPTTPRE